VEVHDKSPKGDFLGFVEINLNNIADLVQREEWFELQKRKKKDKVTGEILLRTKIRPERKVEETIILRGESFPTIPSFIYNSFWNQHCVRQVSITQCGISSIPDGISALGSLEMLQVSGNSISSVPKTLGRIFTLKFLDISDNKISDLPQELANLKNLQFLHLNGNKWAEDVVPVPIVDLDLWCDIVGKPITWDGLIEEQLRIRESQEESGSVMDQAALAKEKEIQRLLENMK
jgi:Leucine-rich repeat (LRR) protein